MRSIEEIEKEKAKYEKKIEELNKELRDLSIQTTRKKTEKKNTTLRVGDRAVITNDCKGKKGIEGNITRSTGDFTFLQDKYGVIYKRAHHNIARVKKDE